MDAKEFRDRMSALPEPPSDSKPPYWDYWRHNIWQHAVDGDDPRHFFDWECVYHCMLWRHRPDAIEHERMDIARNDTGTIDSTWAARDPGFAFPSDLQPGTYTSQSMLHQLYHLMRFEQITGLNPAKMRKITEFGGGFGAMAAVLSRLGYCGKYAIYDLPEFLLLQEYYLSNIDVHNVKFYNDAATLSKKYGRSDLLIACYSLSEIPIDRRNLIMPFLPADNYLFLYSNKFSGYDNMEYFKYYAELSDDLNWHHEQIEHLPEGNLYSFGWKKS